MVAVVTDEGKQKSLMMTKEDYESFRKRWDQTRSQVLHGLRKGSEEGKSVSGRRFR